MAKVIFSAIIFFFSSVAMAQTLSPPPIPGNGITKRIKCLGNCSCPQTMTIDDMDDQEEIGQCDDCHCTRPPVEPTNGGTWQPNLLACLRLEDGDCSGYCLYKLRLASNLPEPVRYWDLILSRCNPSNVHHGKTQCRKIACSYVSFPSGSFMTPGEVQVGNGECVMGDGQ